jgi:hypothetical protein
MVKLDELFRIGLASHKSIEDCRTARGTGGDTGRGTVARGRRRRTCSPAPCDTSGVLESTRFELADEPLDHAPPARSRRRKNGDGDDKARGVCSRREYRGLSDMPGAEAATAA